MADATSQFELADNVGSTVIVTGTATTGGANFPSVAGNVISEFDLVNLSNNRNLEWSLDGGTTFATIPANSVLSDQQVRGGAQTQIFIRSDAGTADFQMTLQLEDF